MGTSSSKAVEVASITKASESSNTDLLRDGPCADVFELLEQCQRTKGVALANRALNVCVSEADLLIRCIKKHPAHFHAAEVSK